MFVEILARSFISLIFLQESLEGRLGQLEKEWADFCERTSDLKTEMERKISTWKDFNGDCEKIIEFLTKNCAASRDEIKRGIDLQAMAVDLEKIKVIFHFSFNDFSF